MKEQKTPAELQEHILESSESIRNERKNLQKQEAEMFEEYAKEWNRVVPMGTIVCADGEAHIIVSPLCGGGVWATGVYVATPNNNGKIPKVRFYKIEELMF